MEKETHIRRWVTHTSQRLREIEASHETINEKQARASTCLGFLLEEVVATMCPDDLREEVQHLVAASENIGQSIQKGIVQQ